MHDRMKSQLAPTHALYIHQGCRVGCMEVTKKNGPCGCGAVHVVVCDVHERHSLCSVCLYDPPCMLHAMFTCLSVCAVPCNTVLVCAARSQCDDLFLMDGGCRMHDR